MNEFELIETYFNLDKSSDPALRIGIGDDAACLRLPIDKDLLITTDTLVENVHFFSNSDPFDIAYRSLMVNISDIAAMGGTPRWVSLALTLPHLDSTWLQRFSEGLHQGLQNFHLRLIGGDTTKGPLTITLTVHGLVDKDRAITRKGAAVGDSLFVSGYLGAAALAVQDLSSLSVEQGDKTTLWNQLYRPQPRTDLQPILTKYVSAAIDISDGLSADLAHICASSKVGATLLNEAIPIHPLLIKYCPEAALSLALTGGDDYELCFTVHEKNKIDFLKAMSSLGLPCYCIGTIHSDLNLYLKDGFTLQKLSPKGYVHF